MRACFAGAESRRPPENGLMERFIQILARVGLFVAGFVVVRLIVQGVGHLAVNDVTPLDYQISGWMNPDTYFPVLDECFRAVSDYTNILIGTAGLSWLAAWGLYALFPGAQRIWAGLLALEGIIFAGLALAGKLFPNSTLVGANALEVVAFPALFGFLAWHYARCDRAAMRRWGVTAALMALCGISANQFIIEPVKKDVARPRPFNDAHKPWNETLRRIPDEYLRGANSYPSGHTGGTFALLTPLFLQLRRRRERTLVAGWAVMQGLSRIYTAAHFFFDVLMGAFLGIAVGALGHYLLGGESVRPRDPKPTLQQETPDMPMICGGCIELPGQDSEGKDGRERATGSA